MISDRAAVYVIGETVRCLGQKVQPLTLNQCIIRRNRRRHRKAIVAQLKDDFDPQFPLIVHGDCTLIPELVGTETVDRLPVTVTSNDQSQLLATPNLQCDTGEAQAKAIFAVLKDWNLEEKVQGMYLDNISFNTGQHKGTCTLWEQLIGPKLLHIGFHHHVMELIAGAVFDRAMEASSAQDVLLFKQFKCKLQFIDQTFFLGFSTDDYTKNAVAHYKDEMVN